MSTVLRWPAQAICQAEDAGPGMAPGRWRHCPGRPALPPGGAGANGPCAGDLAPAQGLFVGSLLSMIIWALGLAVAQGVLG